MGDHVTKGPTRWRTCNTPSYFITLIGKLSNWGLSFKSMILKGCILSWNKSYYWGKIASVDPKRLQQIATLVYGFLRTSRDVLCLNEQFRHLIFHLNKDSSEESTVIFVNKKELLWLHYHIKCKSYRTWIPMTFQNEKLKLQILFKKINGIIFTVILS